MFVWLTILSQQDPMEVRTIAGMPIPCPEVDVAELACDGITDALVVRVRASRSVWASLSPPYHQYLQATMSPQNSEAAPDAAGPLFECRMEPRQGDLHVLEHGLVSTGLQGPCLISIPFAAMVSQEAADGLIRGSQTLLVHEERVGVVPDGFSLQDLSLNVQYVTVEGPADTVARADRAVAFIPLYSYFFSAQRTSFEMPVPIQIVDAEGEALPDLAATPDSLVATLTYAALPNMRQLRVRPEPPAEAASGYRLIEVRSEPEFVVLEGSEAVLKTIPDPLPVPVAESPVGLTRTTASTAALVVPPDTTANVAEITFTWEVDHVFLDNTLPAEAACLDPQLDLSYDFSAVFLHLRGPYEAFNLLYERQSQGGFAWQVLYDCPQEPGAYTLNPARFVFQDEAVESSNLITLVSVDPPDLQVRIQSQPDRAADS